MNWQRRLDAAWQREQPDPAHHVARSIADLLFCFLIALTAPLRSGTVAANRADICHETAAPFQMKESGCVE
jgi:hypothetical protein